MIKRALLITTAVLPALALTALPVPVAAQEGETALLHAATDIRDVKSLQRGARNFMNYCSGCHSLTYLRYNRMAADLRLSEKELADLMLTSDNAFDGINSSMPRSGSGSSRRTCR